MHNNDNIITIQDTSTQAMTEVALGLSMAFFALLIIALMSVALPSGPEKNSNQDQTLQHASNPTIDVSEQIALVVKPNIDTPVNKTQDNHKSAANIENAQQDATILLYWGGQFFNTQQQLVNIKEVLNNKEVIVAVSPQIPFNQLITIQTQFAGTQMHLTTLSPPWIKALSNKDVEEQANGA